MVPSAEMRGMPASRPGLIRAIVVAWAVAGTLDIGIALTYYPLTAGAEPLAILRGIASGLVGDTATQGGLFWAGVGLLCHYVIALIWTLCFFLIYPRIAFARRSHVLNAVVFGTFVSVVMRFVVFPLSHVRQGPFDLQSFAVATVILWVAIGLPLTIVAGRHYGRIRAMSIS